MNRELLQQALNALRISAPLGHAMEDYEYRHRLIKDIEAELAKPEQEPVGYFYLRKGVFFHIYEPHNADPEVFPLYTAPPRKPWVGLTDDEINDFDKKLRDNGDYCSLHFAWGISAKLKEKNHGSV
jgi:hypothetical protein